MGRRKDDRRREDLASPAGRAAAEPPATLGDLVEQGLGLFCWCNRCGHNAEVPSPRLAAQLGPSTPVPALARRMRCAGCGGRDIAVRPAWPPRGPICGAE